MPFSIKYARKSKEYLKFCRLGVRFWYGLGVSMQYLSRKPSNDFGNQLSGSIMEFRYWNTALNSGSFDNHVAAPKAFDGNHPSASFEDLVLRYSFDDDKNLDSSAAIRDTSADQSYTQAGTATGYVAGIVLTFER